MFAFLVRKTFYDLWDNFLVLTVLNLGFLLLTAAVLYAPRLAFALAPSVPAVAFVCVAAATLPAAWYTCALSRAFTAVSDRGAFTFATFRAALAPARALPAALALAGLVLSAAFLLAIAIPFYLAHDTFWGSFFGAAAFWIFFGAVLSAQFVPAIFARRTGRVRTLFKESLFFLVDNPMFYLAIGAGALFLFAVSALTLFIWPGPAGILLFWDEAFRLRLKKYIYLEHAAAAPADGGSRKNIKIPWHVILQEERALTGKRGLRQLIFPWK